MRVAHTCVPPHAERPPSDGPRLRVFAISCSQGRAVGSSGGCARRTVCDTGGRRQHAASRRSRCAWFSACQGLRLGPPCPRDGAAGDAGGTGRGGAVRPGCGHGGGGGPGGGATAAGGSPDGDCSSASASPPARCRRCSTAAGAGGGQGGRCHGGCDAADGSARRGAGRHGRRCRPHAKREASACACACGGGRSCTGRTRRSGGAGGAARTRPAAGCGLAPVPFRRRHAASCGYAAAHQQRCRLVRAGAASRLSGASQRRRGA